MKLRNNESPLGQWADIMEGYWVYPHLEGIISNNCLFNGKEVICWSFNDYLGIANDTELLEFDSNNVSVYGQTYPMGSRLLTGDSKVHRRLEEKLADYSMKEAALLLNMGYQGMFSIIDTLLRRSDVVIYDSECHACTIDGVRLHKGFRMSFKHNDMDSLEKCLVRAKKHCEVSNGSILVISEGVFSMRGDQGKIVEIAKFKDTYSFTFLLDDAHGFGVLGKSGRGTHFEQNINDKVDIYFATFTKAFSSTGAFLSGSKEVINFLKYNARSQIYSRSLPLVLVLGLEKRLSKVISIDEKRASLREITEILQKKLIESGFNLGLTNTCITPIHLNGTPYEAMAIVEDLRENFNVFCSMVLYPVVPKGEIILRLIPTSNHTVEDIEHTVMAFNLVAKKLALNLYSKTIAKYKKNKFTSKDEK